MTETITHGKLVSIQFIMYSMDGDILGNTEDVPFKFLHGITPFDPPGLSDFLDGKEIGFSGEVILPPEKAYGEKMLSEQESVAVLPLESFPEDTVPGMMLMAQIGDQGELPITIMDIQGDDVMVYYGHPLAGQTLRFEVKVIDITDPTEEDMAAFQQS